MALETTLNKNQIFHLLRDHAEQVREFGVSKLGLFGSIVRGEETDKSDIDILVEFKEGKKSYHNFIELAFLLDDIFQKEVDLVTRKAIASWLIPYIEKEIEYVEFKS